MDRWLNNWFIVLIFWLALCDRGLSQNGVEPPVYKDYKDPEQFEKFQKRKVTVAAWQIHSLKEEGALVVKLKTNKLLINQLLKSGNKKLAIEKQLEQFAINRNIMFAYKDNYTFSKIYFIYSNSSDSLLNGARQGIFLDSNLVIDPSIVMTEKFYLIAERDFSYSSSIGFVREDTARLVKEAGNPIRLMAIVVKNKYGHQLKNPFPYAVREISYSNISYQFPISYAPVEGGASSIQFPVNKTYLLDMQNKIPQRVIKKEENRLVATSVKLDKEVLYEKLSLAVSRFNDSLFEMYRTYPKPDFDRINKDTKPFLY